MQAQSRGQRTYKVSIIATNCLATPPSSGPLIESLLSHMSTKSQEPLSPSKVPSTWQKWCTTGKHGQGARKKNAVLKCLKSGHVRGYFSDIPLKPDLEEGHSMYPSLEHLVDPNNHSETAVEARIFNDMKSHLSEAEFWRVIEHFFIVGVEKQKIKPPFGKKLPTAWSPKKHYNPKLLQPPAEPMLK